MRRFAVQRLMLGLLLALLVAAACYAADISFPPLTGRVIDQVGVLTEPARQQVTQELADHEARSGQQVVVAIVSSLQGQTIEDYGYQLGRFWGIGQKDKDTGAILLVAPNERKVRIEVGYGLEGQLTDAKSADIIHDIILPAFKQNQMSQGIVAGTMAMLQVLGDSAALPPVTQQLDDRQVPAAAPLHTHPFGLVFFALFFLIWILVVMRGGRAGLAGGLLGAGIQGWGSGGGGFSGGGFSGGGGSFGGGGASGSW